MSTLFFKICEISFWWNKCNDLNNNVSVAVGIGLYIKYTVHCYKKCLQNQFQSCLSFGDVMALDMSDIKLKYTSS